MDEPRQQASYPPEYWASDPLDLRAYVELMLNHWWWIVGCAVLAALSAFAVTSLQPPTYEASSIVMITEPRYQMEFDPRFQTADQWQPAYKAFPELAASDTVLQAVVQAYTPSPAADIEDWRLGVLKPMAEATSQGDPSLVKLQITCRCAEDAAGIANAWADQLAARGNDIYAEGEGNVAFFETQAAQAETTLETAEQALIAFQARDRASIVSAQLSSLRQTQSDYLADQRAVAYLTCYRPP